MGLTMSTKATLTIRPRKMLTNRLLQRRQMILDIHHPGMPTPDKEGLKERVAEFLSKAKGHKALAEATVIFGMKTCFGGGKSTCFALAYDSIDAAKTHEPKHRLIRAGHDLKTSGHPGSSATRRAQAKDTDIKVGRKQRKEKKNRDKKFRGTRKEKRVRAG